jgi:hypothetical protein
VSARRTFCYPAGQPGLAVRLKRSAIVAIRNDFAFLIDLGHGAERLHARFMKMAMTSLENGDLDAASRLLRLAANVASSEKV